MPSMITTSMEATTTPALSPRISFKDVDRSETDSLPSSGGRQCHEKRTTTAAWLLRPEQKPRCRAKTDDGKKRRAERLLMRRDRKRHTGATVEAVRTLIDQRRPRLTLVSW